MKTYRDWLIEGRAVQQGSRAEHYLVSPDGQRSRALFREDQTVPLAPEDDTRDWTAIVSAGERPHGGAKDPRPKVIVDQDQSGVVRIWVGPDAKAIKTVKANRYRFEPSSRRWVAPHKDLMKVVQGFESRGYNVRCEGPVI